MGTVLFMTLPKFRALTFDDYTDTQLNILLNTVRNLKKISLCDGVDYTLHLDAARSIMWISSSGMTPEMIEKAKEKGTALPESFRLTGVDIYGIATNLEAEDVYNIQFSRQGYCDMALIHLQDRSSGEDLTVVIEPFLPDIKLLHRYSAFAQCG